MLKDPDLCFFYGLKFWLGDGLSQNFKRGAWFFEKAAAFGHKDAYFNLGKIYDIGFDDVPKDARKAMGYYLDAAYLGHVGAQYELGVRYELQKNMRQAITWIEKAEGQGNAKAQTWFKDPDKQFSIGLYYEEQNELRKAIERYERAEGDREAAYRLALIYDSLRDKENATKYYWVAAQKKHPKALFGIGLSLEKRGSEEDLKRAVIWYKGAMQQGNSKAIYRLAVMTQRGRGVEKNLLRALDLYKMAAEYGDNDAQAYLDKVRMEIRMSKLQNSPVE